MPRHHHHPRATKYRLKWLNCYKCNEWFRGWRRFEAHRQVCIGGVSRALSGVKKVEPTATEYFDKLRKNAERRLYNGKPFFKTMKPGKIFDNAKDGIFYPVDSFYGRGLAAILEPATRWQRVKRYIRRLWLAIRGREAPLA